MTASKIEWTDRSDWNPIRGCTRVSEGCRHCYAESIAARFSDEGQAFHGFATRTSAGPRWTGRVELVEDRLTLPLRWKKPARIFASSTSDIFHESLPDAAIDRIFAVMALSPQHTFQVLTKRAERMREYLTARDMRDHADPIVHAAFAVWRASLDRDVVVPKTWPLPNVWLGVSVEDQAAADARIPHLLATAAAKRFLSCEPLLGPVQLRSMWGAPDWDEDIRVDALTGETIYPTRDEDDGGRVPGTGLNWVIAGGESGRGARPMHPHWARSLRDQCAATGVPFFFKQWGEYVHTDTGIPLKVGKAHAGRWLDGVQHDGVPA